MCQRCAAPIKYPETAPSSLRVKPMDTRFSSFTCGVDRTPCNRSDICGGNASVCYLRSVGKLKDVFYNGCN